MRLRLNSCFISISKSVAPPKNALCPLYIPHDVDKRDIVWKLFTLNKKDELKELANHEKMLNNYLKKIERLSKDKEYCRMIWDERIEENLRNHDAYETGKHEGKIEGKIQMIINMYYKEVYYEFTRKQSFYNCNFRIKYKLSSNA